MEFRFDLFFRFIMDCIFYALSFAFFEILFLHTDTLAGWQHHEVVFFVAGGLILDAVFMTFIARNIWDIPRLINKGELDFLLIRPVPTLFLMMSRHFELSSFLNLLVSFGVLIFGTTLFPDPLSMSAWFGWLLFLLNGMLLMVCLRMFTVLPVFWTHSNFGFHMLFMSLEQVTERPEVIFRGVSHVIFTTVFPFLVMTSFPARWVFGSLSSFECLYALMLSACFWLFTRYVWQRGLRVYSSASS
ncbi:MAG: ABC-2 family transporter protein [Bdellovibrionales bacterium]|nr:ABC-2 family transporter protein [Bdellovibrionales bacterium]